MMTLPELEAKIQKLQKFLNENKAQTMLRQMVEQDLELTQKIYDTQKRFQESLKR